MRQEVTRAHKGWALDSVVLHNDVIRAMKEDINSPPSVSFSFLSEFFTTNVTTQYMNEVHLVKTAVSIDFLKVVRFPFTVWH